MRRQLLPFQTFFKLSCLCLCAQHSAQAQAPIIFVSQGDIQSFNALNTAGVMFDVQASSSSDIQIHRLDQRLNTFTDDDAAVYDVRVYYKDGTYVNFENDSESWTKVSDSVVSVQNNDFSAVIELEGVLPIAAGTTRAVYIAFLYSSSMNDDANAGVDDLVDVMQVNRVSYVYNEMNADLQITGGTAVSSLFDGGGVFSTAWIGSLYYTLDEFPTAPPVIAPSRFPTTKPTKTPTKIPTKSPTDMPTGLPTTSPTLQASFSPTFSPTKQASLNPTDDPTHDPSLRPSIANSMQPSNLPTSAGSLNPTLSHEPTVPPTNLRSASPSISGSSSPTLSHLPSLSPSFSPTASPTYAPSKISTLEPSLSSAPTSTRYPTGRQIITEEPSLAKPTMIPIKESSRSTSNGNDDDNSTIIIASLTAVSSVAFILMWVIFKRRRRLNEDPGAPLIRSPLSSTIRSPFSSRTSANSPPEIFDDESSAAISHNLFNDEHSADLPPLFKPGSAHPSDEITSSFNRGSKLEFDATDDDKFLFVENASGNS